jgi:hypothetical protein
MGGSLRFVWIMLVLMLAGFIFVLRPVCVPLSADDLASFNTPIETRTDRDFYLQVFQQADGRWYQCKTWLSRQFFF